MYRLLTGLCFALLLGSCSDKADFVDVDGKPQQFGEANGRWMLVNYWATWCAPCIKEIPEFNEIHADHSDHVAVYGVNFDEPAGEEAQKQIKKMKLAFPVFAQEPSSILGVEKPQVLPTTLVFAPEGKLPATLIGPQTGSDLRQAIELPVNASE